MTALPATRVLANTVTDPKDYTKQANDAERRIEKVPAYLIWAKMPSSSSKLL